MLAAILIGFALNSIAHVAHQHEVAAASIQHSVHCGYCISFGALADATRHTFSPPLALTSARVALPSALAIRSVEQRTSARPRAPPVS
jgi:hypothetical protein